MLVSYILATHNRSAALERTLQRIHACGLPADQYEIIVVDNASTDGTADHVRKLDAGVHLVPLARNRGSCAKTLGVPHARGTYVVFLDDDAYPLDDTIEQMIDHFEADPRLGAAGFVAFLTDGSKECSALPNVFIGCGVGFRRSALQEVGGLDLSYFMQAEEYDLSFRLLQAGYHVFNFEDLLVLHEKTPLSRCDQRRIYYDVRNNLTLAWSFLPEPWLDAFKHDWLQRYRWLARDVQAEREFRRGKRIGTCRGRWRRWTRRSRLLNQAELDRLFGVDRIAAEMGRLRAENLTRITLADLGKNVYAYHHAAGVHDIQIAAVMDDRFAAPGRFYRGAPLLTYEEGLALHTDAIVISNSSAVHAQQAEWKLKRRTALPIFRWHSHFQQSPQARPSPAHAPHF